MLNVRRRRNQQLEAKTHSIKKCWIFFRLATQRGQAWGERTWERSFLWSTEAQFNFPNNIIQIEIFTLLGLLECLTFVIIINTSKEYLTKDFFISLVAFMSFGIVYFHCLHKNKAKLNKPPLNYGGCYNYTPKLLIWSITHQICGLLQLHP